MNCLACSWLNKQSKGALNTKNLKRTNIIHVSTGFPPIRLDIERRALVTDPRIAITRTNL